MRLPVGFESAEAFLVHARSANTAIDEHALTYAVAECVLDYKASESATWGGDFERIQRALEGVEIALAALLPSHFEFDDEDESAPFRDEQAALAWLQRPQDGSSLAYDDDFIIHCDDWLIGTLARVRQEFERQLFEIQHFETVGDRNFEHRTKVMDVLFVASRLPLPVQKLIFSICAVWRDHVDSALGLPRRDSEPDNPLLRFLDVVLSVALKERLPKKTLLQFVQRSVRPRFRKLNASDDADVGVDLARELPF